MLDATPIKNRQSPRTFNWSIIFSTTTPRTGKYDQPLPQRGPSHLPWTRSYTPTREAVGDIVTDAHLIGV